MSLEITNLSKTYGQQKAVNDISFKIERGEIVGFLGPNGAGKSTTMKIITGFLPPTSGKVLVEGMDVAARSLAIKKITGYLPEHNPLYLDMYVQEYLHFVGKLYKLPAALLKQRIAEVIDRCGLALEQHKKIEALSKGYRQRVGLAQALIHDPAVLILDEPTSGLDPNQIIEIRKLIKDVSENKTVLFSTHIMQEVQVLCDRVIVINKGEIVADDQLQNLLRSKEGLVVVIVEFEGAISVTELHQLPGVKEVSVIAGKKFKIVSDTDLRSELFRLAADKNLSLIGLRQEENSLEDIFRGLTTVAN